MAQTDDAGSAPPRPPEPGVSGLAMDLQKKEEERSFLRETPILVLLAFAFAIFIKTFLIQAFYIPSSSMAPTLEPGDRVLVSKLSYRFGDIHRGDVLVFQNPDVSKIPNRSGIGAFVHWLGEGIGLAQPEGEDLIKRVVGLPGDTVQIGHHTVSVNGKPLTELYLTREARQSMGVFGPVTVPRGELFVMGDNRGHSMDSRVIGFVPEHNVVGKAVVVIWPPVNVGGVASG
jgi:signal peptidase I